MSLNVKTITVGDRDLTLRLTSKALMQFNLKHGIEGNTPTIAVLGAVSDMAARIDLFTNALTHPESKNSVKDGGLLLDLMADDPSWSRDEVNQLILELASESGLIHPEEVSTLLQSVKDNCDRTITTLGRMLSGEAVHGGSDSSTESEDAGESEENPT